MSQSMLAGLNMVEIKIGVLRSQCLDRRRFVHAWRTLRPRLGEDAGIGTADTAPELSLARTCRAGWHAGSAFGRERSGSRSRGSRCALGRPKGGPGLRAVGKIYQLKMLRMARHAMAPTRA
jgi:hypothetical protein